MRSDTVKKGSTRAAHRALFYAMGYTPEDLKKPLQLPFNDYVINRINEQGYYNLIMTGLQFYLLVTDKAYENIDERDN